MIHFKPHTPFWKRLVTVQIVNALNLCFLIWHWIEFRYLAQIHLCPFNKASHGSDRWTATNWSRILHWEDKLFHWGSAYNGIREVVWLDKWRPRACSFCGSIHPDDAVKLCACGWTIEKIDGSKFRIEPVAWTPK